MASITAVSCDMQAGQDQRPDSPSGFLIGKKTTKNPVDQDALLEYMAVWQEQLKQNWQHGYTQMPDEVAADPSLSPRAKHLYRALLSFMWLGTDRCWPSQGTLAECTGYSRSTVIRALNDLYERGYIEVWRRGFNLTNYYFINPLSFVKSFKGAWRGRGVRLPVRTLHQATMETTPAPDVLHGLSGMCQPETSSSSNVEQQDGSTCDTMHTNQKQINKNSIPSNHSTATSGGGVAGAAIRNASDEPASSTPTTETEGTNPSHTTATQPNPNPTEKQKDELAAPRRAKAALANKQGTPHGGAAAIAAATGIPAEHLAELGVAPERKKRPIPDFIQRVIQDFSVELGDNPRSYRSSVTRATKIYYTALAIFTDIQDDPEGHFLRAMYDAKIASGHVTNVRHHTGTRPNRMPAFFTCLENHFGFRPEEREYLRSDEPLYAS